MSKEKLNTVAKNDDDCDEEEREQRLKETKTENKDWK